MTLIGSFLESSENYHEPWAGLVCSPRAEFSLEEYLSSVVDSQNSSKRETLSGFFGCLLSAFDCLRRDRRLGHHRFKISTSNIFVYDEKAFFGDIYSLQQRSRIPKEKYHLPATTLRQIQPRHETSPSTISKTQVSTFPSDESITKSRDQGPIEELGRVFLAIFAALRGERLSDIYSRMIERNGKKRKPFSLRELAKLAVSDFEKQGDVAENRPLRWIRAMLESKGEQESNIKELLEQICMPSEGGPSFCGSCCMEDNCEYENQISQEQSETSDCDSM